MVMMGSNPIITTFDNLTINKERRDTFVNRVRKKLGVELIARYKSQLTLLIIEL